MKTHRITLPAEWHALTLRGVSRLLLPMKPQPPEWAAYESIAALGDDRFVHWMDGASVGYRCWPSDEPVCFPYRAGDRLALLEPWANPSLNEFEYKAIGGSYKWQPASRMPLPACRCFYRVVSVEPVRISDISEEHARECGFEDEKVNEFPPVRSAKSPLYEAWLAVGRSGADWAWSVRVEKEDYGMKVGVLVKCELCGHQKKPRGRSGPLGGYYCEPEWFGHGCPGWAQEPRVGDLWPGETEADFGFPVSADGTEEVADANTH